VSTTLAIRNADGLKADAEIASNQGWGDLCRWTEESCPPADYIDLRQLTDHGLCDSAVGLRGELDDALALNPPPDVADVFHAMIDALADVGGEDFAFVTDGLGPDTAGDDGGDPGDEDDGGELLAALGLEPDTGGEG